MAASKAALWVAPTVIWLVDPMAASKALSWVASMGTSSAAPLVALKGCSTAALWAMYLVVSMACSLEVVGLRW